MSKKKEEALKKGIQYAMLGALVSFVLTIASTTTEDPKTGKLQFKFQPALIGTAAGVVSGWLFALIQAYEDGLQAYQKELEESKNNYAKELSGYKQAYENELQVFKNELSQLISIHEQGLSKTSDLADRARVSLDHYETIRKLLGSDKRQRDLIGKFIGRAMEHIYYIPRARPGYFYDLLTEGIGLSYSWYGIHHGPISTLGKHPLDPAGFLYFDTLNNSQIENKKRLIILSEEDQLELQKPDVMKEFWEKNCKVKSYWISEKTFYSIQSIQEGLRVDDCALYNENVFLHYDRKKELVILAFENSNEPIFKAVKITFDEMNKFEHNRSSYIQFNQITENDIPN